MNEDEFSSPVAEARRGLTAVEAAEVLRTAAPGERRWMAWEPRQWHVCQMVTTDSPEQGAVGPWHWRRVSCPYPHLFHCRENAPAERRVVWTGLVEVTAPDQSRFFLFSYMDDDGCVGGNYVVSTLDLGLLAGFSEALRRHLAPANTIAVHVPGGEGIQLDAAVVEPMCLPQDMRADIERQALGFFPNEQEYHALGIPHRRGLLFAGPAGCGKTMMVRHLIRQIHRQTAVTCWAFAPHTYLTDEVLVSTFGQARDAGRAIIVIEDVERLASTDSRHRPALLSQMDGLAPNSGLLVLATTNHPGMLDPAIVKRPSRFDRTWVFALPDESLRREYLQRTLGALGSEWVAAAAGRTADWSFAYLNELRVTAGILAMDQGVPPGLSHANQALDTLARQFAAAGAGFRDDGRSGRLGFGKTV